jgi:hypothetical protein
MTFKDFVGFLIANLVKPLFALFLGAAVVFFLWNIFGVIKNSDNPEELATLKQKAVWGAVAIAVMVSMWGLVNFFTGSLRLNTGHVSLPQYNLP